MGELEEFNVKNAELNEEIKVYESKFSGQEDELNLLADQCEELDRMTEEKVQLIETLDNEINKAKQAKLENDE